MYSSCYVAIAIEFLELRTTTHRQYAAGAVPRLEQGGEVEYWAVTLRSPIVPATRDNILLHRRKPEQV